MRQRRGTEIEKEVIDLLSQRECIISTIQTEVGINNKTASRILAKLDEQGVLIKESKPSNRKNIICLHYHISLSTEEETK